MPAQNSSPFPKMDFLQKVKYGGAVGKKSAVTIVALIVLGIAIAGVVAIALRVGFESVPFGILILALIGGLAFLASHVFKHALGSIDTTLKNHPELALMDGSEWVSYQKALLAAKNIPVLSEVSEPLQDPRPPIEIFPQIEGEVSEPEEPEDPEEEN